MPATEALDVDRLFVRAMNEGDIETIMSLYTEETAFVQAPGEPALTGLDNMRTLLLGFLDLGPTLRVELKQFVQAGDIALFSVRWTMEGEDKDGKAVTMTGADANVVRGGPDGSWTTLIDNPFHEEFLRA